jgi:hypothetical protein
MSRDVTNPHNKPPQQAGSGPQQDCIQRSGLQVKQSVDDPEATSPGDDPSEAADQQQQSCESSGNGSFVKACENARRQDSRRHHSEYRQHDNDDDASANQDGPSGDHAKNQKDRQKERRTIIVTGIRHYIGCHSLGCDCVTGSVCFAWRCYPDRCYPDSGIHPARRGWG